jgi:hypothetical protein
MNQMVLSQSPVKMNCSSNIAHTHVHRKNARTQTQSKEDTEKGKSKAHVPVCLSSSFQRVRLICTTMALMHAEIERTSMGKKVSQKGPDFKQANFVT